MSTKEIRQALSEWRASAEAHGLTNTVAHIDVAIREVEAIEKAARAIMTPGVQDEQDKADAYWLLNAIRKQTEDLTPR